MKKTKKQFAVKLWLEFGEPFVAVVEANDKKEAFEFVKKKLHDRYGEVATEISSARAKELPICEIRTAFGHVPIKVVPNPYYNNEIIINNERINLPDVFNYWDINNILIHNAGLPCIATIDTDKGKFVVQNNVNGCGKRFEIIK